MLSGSEGGNTLCDATESLLKIRDWSLIKGRLQSWRGGGACEVLTQRKEGAEKVFAHAEGGGGRHKQFWGSFYTVHSFSHTEGVGDARSFHSLIGGGGGKNFYPVLRWGRKKFRTHDFLIFVASPPRN